MVNGHRRNTQIIGFNIIFALKLFLSRFDAIYNIEQHFDNIGLYAIFLSLSAIILITYHSVFNSKYTQVAAIIIYIIALYCTIILGSRTASIILASYLILVFLQKKKLAKIKYYIGFTSIIVIVILAAVKFKQNSSYGRYYIWRTTSYIINDHFLMGIGYNNFPSVYPTYQAAMYTEGKMSENEIYLADNVKVAFNEYLHITAELGVVGLVTFLFLIGVYFYYTRCYGTKIILFCICLAMAFSYRSHLDFLFLLIFFSNIIIKAM